MRNFCNVTYFQQCIQEKQLPALRVRFSLRHIEVTVLEANLRDSKTYSLLKTALVDIMNKVGEEYKSYKYKFNICCPKSKGKMHFIPFEISDTSIADLKCMELMNKNSKCDCKLSNKRRNILIDFSGFKQHLLAHQWQPFIQMVSPQLFSL